MKHETETEVEEWDGHTPLTHAAAGGHSEVLRLLVAANANVNHAGRLGVYRALDYAIRGGHWQVVKLLSEANAQVIYSNGCLPLIDVVAQWGQVNADVVKLLLDAGADVDAAVAGDTALFKADVNAGKPLVRAVRSGDLEIVKLLVNAGAQVDVADANSLVESFKVNWENEKLLRAANVPH